MQKVEVGQVWSVLSSYCRNRIEFEVRRLEQNKGEARAYGTIVGGNKEISFLVSALGRGMRGARIVRYADGHEAYKESPKPEKENASATASDFRKEQSPRGVATASPRMEEAARMRTGGMSIAEIAAHFRVSKATVSNWCLRVREKREDIRARRLLEGGGS
jgi:DNA-directed RNA polymerase specialized sigma24 family protein